MTKTAIATATYAILVEYKWNRGAALGFTLPEAIRLGGDLGPPDSLSITVRYVDGRDDLYIDAIELTRPSLTLEAARTNLIDIARKNVIHTESGGRWMFGPPPDDALIAEWREWIAEGPPEEEVIKYQRLTNPVWFSDSELAAYEREHLSR